MNLLEEMRARFFNRKARTRNRQMNLADEICARHLDLMARTLDGTIYGDPPLLATSDGKFDPVLRESGWDWPSKAFTMIGTKRLANVRQLSELVLRKNVPGDFVETGVWRGGACIMARAVFAAYGVTDRRVVLCDSFMGLPAPNTEKYPADDGSKFHEYDDLAVSMETVKENFSKFDLLDDQVVFLPGWFRDTMPIVPSVKIAILRLDGDLYESTIEPLEHLYDRVSPSGWIIVDDYHVVPSAKAAVHDFLELRKLKPTIHEIDGVGVYFQKV